MKFQSKLQLQKPGMADVFPCFNQEETILWRKISSYEVFTPTLQGFKCEDGKLLVVENLLSLR